MFSCPDCNGVLWELDEDAFRFRCRVGHASTGGGLALEQLEEIEDQLWSATRGMAERADLLERLASRAHERGNAVLRKNLIDTAVAVRRQARELNDIIRRLRLQPPAPDGA